MINQDNLNDHTKNTLFAAINELQIAKLLRKPNITKSYGISAFEVFRFVLLLVFQGKIYFVFCILNIKIKLIKKILTIAF